MNDLAYCVVALVTCCNLYINDARTLNLPLLISFLLLFFPF
jgi:hypothetical protein